MKVLIVRLEGGLGNQLFQYAVGKAIAKKNNSKLLFDISSFEKDDYGRTCTIQKYDIDNPKFIEGGIWGKMITTGNRIFGLAAKLQIIEWKKEKDFSFHKDFASFKKLVGHLQGYWQTDDYFYQIRNELLSEFKPKGFSQTIQKIIKKDRVYVAVHIRRLHGKLADENRAVDDRYGLLDLSYYHNAISYFREKTRNVCFVIFSDDIDWCKENLIDENHDCFFMDDPQYHEDFIQLYLMSTCDHQIIANSSFSWWGAWLNPSKDKVVIRPERPFNDSKLLYENHYPKEWIAM